MHSLRVEGLCAGYGGPPVLRDVTFSLEPGDVCGVIGPNGAGKSTLLRAILGLASTPDGIIRIDGRDAKSLSRMEMARKTAFLPQEYNHHSRLTVRETVLLGRHPHRPGWSPDSAEDRAIALECMELTGVSHLAPRPFCELSGGERRLVMLASVLAQRPMLLLLDEPAASLDFRHQIEVWQLARRLGSMGVTVLASTHELGISGRFTNRLLVISKGSCRCFGTPDEVCRPDLLSEVFEVGLMVASDGYGGFTVVPHPD